MKALAASSELGARRIISRQQSLFLSQRWNATGETIISFLPRPYPSTLVTYPVSHLQRNITAGFHTCRVLSETENKSRNGDPLEIQSDISRPLITAEDEHLRKEENDDDDDDRYGRFDDDENDDLWKEYYNSDEKSREDSSDVPLTKRLWLDPKSPLKERVNRFVNSPLGSMHHLDITIGSIDLIKQCGKLHSFEGMKYAQDILDRLIEEKRHVNANNTWPVMVVPDRPFQYVMYGWANLCRRVPFASQRMREVLDIMIQENADDKETKERILKERSKPASDDDTDNQNPILTSEDTTEDLFADISCQPTVSTYNTLLQGLSQAAMRSIQAAIEAEEVLSVMEKMHRNRGWHTKPNTRSYSLVLNAFAKCRHDSAGERAEKVLREMIRRHEQDMEAYRAEYQEDYDLHTVENNRRRIVSPDVVAYTSVIQAYGNSQKPGSAEKALALLSELIHSENPAVQVDAFAFANTINVYSKMAAKKASPESRNQAAMRAEEIWWLYVEELERRMGDDSGQTNLEASIVPFNAALKAIAASFTKQSPHQAEELLFKLLEQNNQNYHIYPNTISFNTVMQAWANASKVETSTGPERAEDLLKLLKTSALDDDPSRRVHPNVQSYVIVMNAYAVSRRTDSVAQVHRLLTELLGEARERLFKEDESINAVPFTVLLKAVAKSSKKDDDNIAAVEDPFGVGMDERDKLPIDPYSVAFQTYSEMKFDVHGLGVQPDHFVFSAMLDVIAVHTDMDSVERRQRVNEVFEDACQAGQVSSLVVRSLQNACPNEAFLKELLQLPRGESVTSMETVNVFQRQWTRFVPPQFRRVTKRKDSFLAKSNSKPFQRSKDHGKNKNANNQLDIERRPRKAMQAAKNKDFIF
ncbi:PPR: pentatricopeptide repeat domain containing protein [Nitzschia inconspicua]|uniref:PPR: pentatricopeptide repeat domain containing protein n=1 Tax=Nitzschia inconspicua TaxID=303405 RepID=A0A9K3KTM5_9STRA|nr:PPR: pentatricopeptide repeat domain containing protein [Nitzschia inconspicua]